MGEARPVEGLEHARAVGRGGGGVGRRGRGGVEEELGERGLGRRVRTLRHEEDPRRGRQRHDGALCRGPHARQHAEQRGLARAVWPPDQQPLRLEQAQREALEEQGGALGGAGWRDAEPTQLEHRIAAIGGGRRAGRRGEREGGVQCLEARGETARGRERLAR